MFFTMEKFPKGLSPAKDSAIHPKLTAWKCEFIVSSFGGPMSVDEA